MTELAIAITAVLLVAASQILLKVGIQTVGPRQTSRLRHYPRLLINPWILFSLAISIVGAVLWLIALRKLDLTYAFPLLALNYVLVPLGSAYWFKERMHPIRATAILVITIGVMVCLSGG